MTTYDNWLQAPYAAQDAADARWERRCDRLVDCRRETAEALAGLLAAGLEDAGVALTGIEIVGSLAEHLRPWLERLSYERENEIAVALDVLPHLDRED